MIESPDLDTTERPPMMLLYLFTGVGMIGVLVGLWSWISAGITITEALVSLWSWMSAILGITIGDDISGLAVISGMALVMITVALVGIIWWFQSQRSSSGDADLQPADTEESGEKNTPGNVADSNVTDDSETPNPETDQQLGSQERDPSEREPEEFDDWAPEDAVEGVAGGSGVPDNIFDQDAPGEGGDAEGK